MQDKLLFNVVCFIIPVNLQEVDEKIKNASSIYEFEAKDIDGNMVSLSKYKYVKEFYKP